MNWKTIDSLFLDLDNTLIDHSAAEEKAFAHCFDEAQLHRGVYTKEALLRRYRIINEELWSAYREGRIGTGEVRIGRWDRVLSEQFSGLHKVEDARQLEVKHNHDYENMPQSTSFRPKSADELSAMYLQRYDQSHSAMDGAYDLLMTARERFRFVGLITNGFPEQVQQKLELLQWDSFFDAVVISEVVGVAKPNRRIFDLAQGLCSAETEQIVYVGDNYEVDMVGAKGVAWKTVWFDRFSTHRAHFRDHVDLRVDSLVELNRYLLGA